jgi:hypothetical protein
MENFLEANGESLAFASEMYCATDFKTSNALINRVEKKIGAIAASVETMDEINATLENANNQKNAEYIQAKLEVQAEVDALRLNLGLDGVEDPTDSLNNKVNELSEIIGVAPWEVLPANKETEISTIISDKIAFNNAQITKEEKFIDSPIQVFSTEEEKETITATINDEENLLRSLNMVPEPINQDEMVLVPAPVYDNQPADGIEDHGITLKFDSLLKQL